MARRRLSVLAIAAATLVVAVLGGVRALQPPDSARAPVSLAGQVRGAPHLADATMPASSARDLGVAELRGLRGRHLDQGIKLGAGALATIVAIGALRKRRAVARLDSASRQTGSGHRLGRGPPELLLT